MLLSGKQLLILSSQFQELAKVNVFIYVFFACLQVVDDVDCQPFGVYAFRSTEIKEECSSEDSECFHKEGNFAVDLIHSWCFIRNF